MLLNKFEDQIDVNGDRTGYCKRIAAEMVEGYAGMGGSWDEFILENVRCGGTGGTSSDSTRDAIAGCLA
jgi:hypothetical protein